MGIAHRMAEVFAAKVNRELERAEDPRALLDYSYTLQQDLLRKVQRGVVDVSAARKQVELRRDELRRSADHLQDQAERVLAAGEADLAREALTRRTALLERADGLTRQEADLRAEENRLTAVAERLRAKVEEFGVRKETLKAGYTLAEAETYVNESVAGIAEDMDDTGLARRARDRTAEAEARAAALDDLIESGMWPGAFADETHDAVPADLQARLDQVTRSAAVEEELDAMKARLRDRESSSARPAEHDRPGE